MGREPEDRRIALRLRARRSERRGAAAGDRQGFLEESPAVLERGKNTTGADDGTRHVQAQAARFFAAGSSLRNWRLSGRRSSIVPAIRLHTDRHKSIIVGSATR